MEHFSNLPWWGQVVFVAANTWIVVILGILLRQAILSNHSHLSNLFTKKKTDSADEAGTHSSKYTDA